MAINQEDLIYETLVTAEAAQCKFNRDKGLALPTWGEVAATFLPLCTLNFVPSIESLNIVQAR